MPKVIIFNYPFVWICRLQLIVNCFLIIKVKVKNIERGLKIREKYMELTCMIWFDGLITCTTKMDLVFLIHVTLGFLAE